MDVGDVDHARVHADVADNRAALSIDQDLPASVAEVAIQSVGVSDRDDSDPGITFHITHTAITDRIPCGYVLYLQDRRLQGADVP